MTFMHRLRAIEDDGAAVAPIHPPSLRRRVVVHLKGACLSQPCWTEVERLAALRRYAILDTAPEPEFDGVVALVRTICKTPIALVSLVDADRQWFKARIGTEAQETPVDTSVCALAIQQSEVFEIENLAADPRTAAMSLVADEPSIRFYAGAPLITSQGLPLGSLCAIDTEPRPGGLTADQKEALAILARQVVAQIELRLVVTQRDLEIAEHDRQTLAFQRDAERLKAVEKRLWDTSPDLLVILDVDGVLRRVNPAWTDILGWTPEELIGRHIDTLVVADDADLTRQALAATTHGPLPDLENRYRHKDGSIRWFSWVGVLADGAIYATGRHITAGKDAAEQHRRTEDQLRQAQKVEAVGQLTGGVAHDFNNLLTVIRGSVDLLRRPDLPEARRQRYLEAIADTTERATTLTQQLLAFARRSALKPEVFDVGANVRALMSMVSTLTGSMIKVQVDLGEHPCLVLADRSQFDTAIVNMAVNARDAMNRQGDLTITVRPVNAMPAMRRHPRVAGDFVAVSIADSGSGIAADKIDQIFEPFFTTKSVGEGTGLGLSQVFGFAKQSNGEIQVESGVGEGSTFTLYLPQAAEGQVAAPRAPTPPSLSGYGSTVLVVEDNAEVRSFATEALRELGFETIFAVDADHALAALAGRHEDIDVVFTDVMMPGKTGIELAAEIEALYPKIPVLLTSGYSKVIADGGARALSFCKSPIRSTPSPRRWPRRWRAKG